MIHLQMNGFIADNLFQYVVARILAEELGYALEVAHSRMQHPQRIPTYKMGIRHQRIPVRDYYNDETAAIVRRLYAWEFERFGYEMPA